MFSKLHSVVVSECTIPTETGLNHARDIFFTIHQSAGSVRPGGKPLGMCRHVQAFVKYTHVEVI